MLTLDTYILQIPAGIEWIIIIVVIVLIFFGVKKIPEIARSFGKASTEYQKARIEAERELGKIKKGEQSPSDDRDKLEGIASTLGINYTNLNDEEIREAIEAELHKSKKT
jgi:sec-independent protein translocase protein TatA